MIFFWFIFPLSHSPSHSCPGDIPVLIVSSSGYNTMTVHKGTLCPIEVWSKLLEPSSSTSGLHNVATDCGHHWGANFLTQTFARITKLCCFWKATFIVFLSGISFKASGYWTLPHQTMMLLFSALCSMKLENCKRQLVLDFHSGGLSHCPYFTQGFRMYSCLRFLLRVGQGM
jgi:hypothetical protein